MIFDLSNISTNEGRDHFGRLEATNIDQALDMVKGYFFKPEFQSDLTIDWIDEDEVIIGSFEPMPDDIPEEEEDFFEAEYTGIEIVKSDDQETRDFKTVFGENNFYTLQDGKVKKPMDQYTMIQNMQKLEAALK
jgi:hypothetical protein